MIKNWAKKKLPFWKKETKSFLKLIAVWIIDFFVEYNRMVFGNGELLGKIADKIIIDDAACFGQYYYKRKWECVSVKMASSE